MMRKAVRMTSVVTTEWGHWKRFKRKNTGCLEAIDRVMARINLNLRKISLSHPSKFLKYTKSISSSNKSKHHPIILTQLMRNRLSTLALWS